MIPIDSFLSLEKSLRLNLALSIAKKHFGIYAQAIKDRKIPREWTDRYVQTEIERKAAAEDEFTKIELTENPKVMPNNGSEI